MNYKTKSILFISILSWLGLGIAIYYFYTEVIQDIFYLPSPLLKWGIIIGSSLVISVLVNVLTLNFNESFRLKFDAEAELYDHGYTEKYLDLLEKQADFLADKPANNNFAPTLVRLANTYLFFERPNDAYQCINRLNPKELQLKFTSGPVYQKNLMDFYDVQMAVCEELGNLQRADAVMQDARPFIDHIYKKSMTTDLVIAEMCCTYYSMYGDFDIAQTFVKYIESKGSAYAFYCHMMNAKICNYRGDYNGADAYLHSASVIAGKKKMLSSIVCEYQKLLERKRCQLQNNSIN